MHRFAHPRIWTPEITSEPRFSDRIPAQAAVLVPLVQRDELRVLLTRRTAQLSSHSGQVAFPGGKSDPEDADAVATALREAHEEIGLEPHFTRVLGTLPVYATGSGFMVTPVVALVDPEHSTVKNPHEVDAIFEVPLSFLMNPANHRHHAVQWEGVTREWLSMPYHDGDEEHFIWGATASMLRNFYRFLLA